MEGTKQKTSRPHKLAESPSRKPYMSSKNPFNMSASNHMSGDQPCTRTVNKPYNMSANKPYKIMAPSMPENMSPSRTPTLAEITTLPSEFIDSEKKFVTQLVNNNSVVVFSKTHCPHCTDTKSILANKGVKYKTVELDKMSHGPLVQNVLQEMTSARTVPRIFIDGVCVGGNSDLKTLNATGQLEDLLKDLKS